MNMEKLSTSIYLTLNQIYQKKNSDYGDSFGKSFRKRGIAAAMVRMEDKWNRLDNLTLHPENIQVNDESIEDTLIDLANYCLMTYMELNPIEEALCSTKTKADADCAITYVYPGNTDVSKSNWTNKNQTIISAVNQQIIDYATSSHCDSEYE